MYTCREHHREHGRTASSPWPLPKSPSIISGQVRLVCLAYHVDTGKQRRVMIRRHEAGRLESLGLMNQHVAAFIIRVVGHHETGYRMTFRSTQKEKKLESIIDLLGSASVSLACRASMICAVLEPGAAHMSSTQWWG